MNLLALPAFADNYLWMLHDGRHAVVVDPGDAAPVIAALAEADLQLVGILVTHRHSDHVGGLADLQAHPRGRHARIIGPAEAPMPAATEPVHDGDRIDLMGLTFTALHLPGHTLDHLGYVVTPPGEAAILFCGDTLFSGGCGRLFEGTPAQMHVSLQRLAALPGDTRVCCAHEYTLSNLRFARAVEPGNDTLADYAAHCADRRERDLPTLPSTIGQERAINPFLRCDQPGVIAAAAEHGAATDDPVAVFTALRQWKDHFR
jgi:hydroxyacylglutathione hydrolase